MIITLPPSILIFYPYSQFKAHQCRIYLFLSKVSISLNKQMASYQAAKDVSQLFLILLWIPSCFIALHRDDWISYTIWHISTNLLVNLSNQHCMRLFLFPPNISKPPHKQIPILEGLLICSTLTD